MSDRKSTTGRVVVRGRRYEARHLAPPRGVWALVAAAARLVRPAGAVASSAAPVVRVEAREGGDLR